jgi:TonB family protein
MDAPQSDTKRLLKAGGFSLFFHTVIIIFLIVYLKAGGSNGGASSVYRVTIHPLSSQGNSNLLSSRGLPTAQTVATKTHRQKEEVRLREKQEQPTLVPMASTPESSPRDEAQQGQEGAGSSGRGEGTGTGSRFLGLRGFDRSRVSSPRYIEDPEPEYPLEARQKGYEGKVLLKVEVLTNGRVGTVEVERSSGYKALDQSAFEAMKKWRFIPAKRGKVPIRSWVNILITFQLRESGF